MKCMYYHLQVCNDLAIIILNNLFFILKMQNVISINFMMETRYFLEFTCNIILVQKKVAEYKYYFFSKIMLLPIFVF